MITRALLRSRWLSVSLPALADPAFGRGAMKSRLLAGLLFLVGSPIAAHADLVTYDFQTTGPFSGFAGSFTYDDSIVPPGGGTLTGPGLFTNLTFPGYTGDTRSLEF